MEAHARDVLGSALFALVQCLPSLAAAEVWRADGGGNVRCIVKLIPGGRCSHPNKRVDGVIHEKGIEEFCSGMDMHSMSVAGSKSLSTADRRRSIHSKAIARPGPPASDPFPPNPVLRPERTPGILAAPFRDVCFKVGNTWGGADRLARGFALVLRTPASIGPGELDTGRNGYYIRGSSQYVCPTAAATETENGPNGSNVEDGRFLATVAQEVEKALACVRGRERRSVTRALALKRLSALCTMKTISGREANAAVLAEISAVLPGCRAYVGVLEPGGECLLYEAATANSNMLARKLHRGEGVSFNCLDTPDIDVRVIRYHPPVPPAPAGPPRPPSLEFSTDALRPSALQIGAEVEVWYASSWLPATITRSRGHGLYDVAYEGFGEMEAGVPRWRLQETVVSEHLDVKVFPSPISGGTDAPGDSSRESWPWPFVCLPLRSDGHRIGVLGVDGWASVQLGRAEETHPEKPVVNFLKQTASLLATALYAERRTRALATLGATVRGKDTTEDGALETLIVLLRETVTFRRRIDILETRVTEPGMVYCRGRWGGHSGRRGTADCRAGDSTVHCDEARRHRQGSVQVFEVDVAPLEEELCITPLQIRCLGTREVLAAKAKSTYDDLTQYQREVHLIARDGQGASCGSKATALASRPGEIIGRFQRLAARPGGGRPTADGWFLVRVARTLPGLPPTRKRPEARVQSKVSKATGGMKPGAEDGDVSLLADMCRTLEVGFMAIATREQQACVRIKALDRVLACCGGFSVSTSSENQALTLTIPAMATVRGSNSTHGIFGTSHDISNDTKISPNQVPRIDLTKPIARAEAVPGSSRGAVRAPRSILLDRKPVKSSKSAAMVAVAGQNSTSTVPSLNHALSSIAGTDSKPMLLCLPSGEGLASPVTPAAAAVAYIQYGGTLIFSVPIPPPTTAETPDGRKGALVVLKDGRLGVLVQQGERRVAVVELSGGKQQILAESEVW